jgi:hypothetical protein
MSLDADTSGSGDKAAAESVRTFSGYQKFVIALLAFLQFSIVMDFMIISPLGAISCPISP